MSCRQASSATWLTSSQPIFSALAVADTLIRQSPSAARSSSAPVVELGSVIRAVQDLWKIFLVHDIAVHRKRSTRASRRMRKSTTEDQRASRGCGPAPYRSVRD